MLQGALETIGCVRCPDQKRTVFMTQRGHRLLLQRTSEHSVGYATTMLEYFLIDRYGASDPCCAQSFNRGPFVDSSSDWHNC